MRGRQGIRRAVVGMLVAAAGVLTSAAAVDATPLDATLRDHLLGAAKAYERGGLDRAAADEMVENLAAS